MPIVPLFTPQGRLAQAELVLTRTSGDVVQIVIGPEFAGRTVEEELDLSVLRQIGGDEAYRCNLLLGLVFETDGREIMGAVGAGSGNFGFVVKREDWSAALDELERE